MKTAVSYILNGSTLKLDTLKCTGCGMCVEVCPHNVFAMNGRKAVVGNSGSCMECGACKMNCPAGAIDVRTGVGCAAAVLTGFITGKEANCGCSDGGGPSCC